METISIPLSKRKLAMILAGSLLFVVAGIYFLITPATFTSPVMPNETITFIIGGLAILFFGFCALYAVKKLFDDNPGLVIDDYGITDNSGGLSAGIVPWNEIDGIDVAQVQNQRFILIMVNNPEKYIDAQKGGIRKRMMKVNYRMYNTPICISPNGLQTNFDDLYKTLKNSYRAVKKI